MNIVGISAYYHDSAAALVRDGVIVSAAQEERFTRRKHDAGFPARAIEYCLAEGAIGLEQVDYVAFYDKPFLKFERLLETYLAFAPKGLRSFITAMPVWLTEKLYLKKVLRDELAALGGADMTSVPKLLFGEHHQSHAASAFFPSPFERAAVLCMDGVGEWATTSVWRGAGNALEPCWQIDFPHSLGLLYSAFTHFAGFKVNSGEYKLMGLAPYGEPKFVGEITEHLVDVKRDGSFRLNMDYFDYAAGLEMTNERFADLFGGPRRAPESAITQREMDLAASVQAVTEDIVLKLAHGVHNELGETALCLAGGVALNCVANGRLVREGPFERVWIQPAAGDAGGALGAALAAWYQYLGNSRQVGSTDAMRGACLGPSFGADAIRERIDTLGAVYSVVDDGALFATVAEALADEHVVGWFQGRMEFGPRALGGRSILGDPRSPRMQSVMNLKIKHRESFRPFAPSVLREHAAEWFELDMTSPYMLLVAPVAEAKRRRMTVEDEQLFGIEKLNVPRSVIPAVTHVDYSARVQTVDADTHPRYHALLRAFAEISGCPVLVNTSFNVRGEPMVCTPEDAYRCFMRTEMDDLVIGNFVLRKPDQPAWKEDEAMTFELD